MKHVFYFLTIFPIMWEVMNVVSIKRTHQFALRLKAMKGKKNEKYSRIQQAYGIWGWAYIIWNFIGFFSFQWPVFLGLFFLGLIPKKYIWGRWLDSFISLIILIFIVLNAYHFKIDIW